MQHVEVLVVDGPHDDWQRRVDLPHLTQNVLGRAQVGKRDHQHAGALDTRGDQHLAPRRVAIDDVLARRGCLAHPIRIEIERDVADAFARHEARQILAATPEATDHRVLFLTHRARRQRRQLQGAHQPLTRREAHDDAVAVLDDDRCQQHRDHQRRQHGLHDDRRRQGGFADIGEQDEAELAAGAQPQAAAHRCTGHRTVEARQAEDDSGLDEQNARQHGSNEREIAQHQRRVEHHADRHEEETKQDVAKWLDVFLDLMPEFGLRDQHPGDEGAECHGESGRLAQPGHAERHEQHVEDEQFGRLAARHRQEPAAEQPFSEQEYQRQQQRGLEQRDAHDHDHLFRRARERGDQHE